MKDPRSKAEQTRELDAMMQEFLKRGGAVTQCAPGPSEEIVYKGTFARRAKKQEG
ncbi:hypothetical protein [Arenibaculum pallidiluteum]|uniref:hypothetical protein n=1 Tax=Arenibaculum pallidiluteum TaxID=2812559 RepID=UPI001A96BC09|nr:hypothetical protein [Arenibaculum pallidiluteum]